MTNTNYDGKHQSDTTRFMNHTNSEVRGSLNACTPFRLSLLLLNLKLHDLLKLVDQDSKLSATSFKHLVISICCGQFFSHCLHPIHSDALPYVFI